MTHYTGFIVSIIRNAIAAGRHDNANKVSIDNLQQNAAHGIHQARVRLEGDPTIYRMILAPADAPIEFGGREASTYFARPLGDGWQEGTRNVL